MNSATIATFMRYKYLLANLITRDLKVKYRRSVLGILWSLLNPILLMLVLSAVFSMLVRGNIENFPVYLICGQTLFTFFSEATSGALFSVVGSAPLIKKVYVPKYIFPLEKTLFAFVNLLFSFIAVLVIMVVFRIKASWTMLLFPVPLVGLLLFATGVGMLLSTLCVFFRDIQYLYTVITTVWMYMTPILYPIEMLQGSFVYPIVKINPLTYYITMFRDVMMYGRLPQLTDLLYGYGVGLLFLIAGLWFFRRKQDDFILHI